MIDSLCKLRGFATLSIVLCCSQLCPVDKPVQAKVLRCMLHCPAGETILSFPFLNKRSISVGAAYEYKGTLLTRVVGMQRVLCLHMSEALESRGEGDWIQTREGRENLLSRG